MKTIGEIKIDEDGTRTTGEVVRVTKDALGGSFGKDKNHRLVVELRDGDVIVLRPHRCRTGVVTLELKTVYRYGLQLQANLRHLEKARHRKSKLRDQRINRSIQRAERRLTT